MKWWMPFGVTAFVGFVVIVVMGIDKGWGSEAPVWVGVLALSILGVGIVVSIVWRALLRNDGSRSRRYK